jgi:hypothetical protein
MITPPTKEQLYDEEDQAFFAKLPPLLPHDEWVKLIQKETEECFDGDPQDYGDN